MDRLHIPGNKTRVIPRQKTATTGIEITRLSEARWQDYRDLRLEALQESSLAFGSSYEEECLLSEDEWKRRMHNALFALADGQAVGLIVVVFNRRAKTKHIADIFSFYVKNSYRHKGVGRKLLEAAIAEIRARNGVIKARLAVNTEQNFAVRLYRRYGFKTLGRVKKELLIDGKYYDELLMDYFIKPRD